MTRRVPADPGNDAEHVAARTRRERTKSGDIQSDGKKLVRVKVIGESGTADHELPLGMAVVLAKGRRIELSRDFDATQLRRVVETLEGF